jgi:hypothetical protein
MIPVVFKCGLMFVQHVLYRLILYQVSLEKIAQRKR